MIVTSDSGPIISFVRAKRLELLKQVLQEIKIPNAVYEEIVIKGSKKPGVEEVKGSNWIKKVNVKDRFKVDQLPSRLGLGERETIILAQELGATLLVDDRSARKEAERRGVICFGSLRVLKDAKEMTLVKETKPILDGLRRAGLRIKNSLYQGFLQEMGE